MPASLPRAAALTRRLVGVRCLTVLLFVSALARLDAQVVYTGPSGTATAPTTGNWNNPAHWSGNALPPSDATTHLSFGGSGTGTYTATNDLGAPFVLNRLTLNSTSATAPIALAGSDLQFSGAAALLEQTGAGPATISTAIDFSSDTEIAVVGTGTLTLSGSLSLDSMSVLEKTGTGTLIIGGSANNSLAELLITAGEVHLAKTDGAVALDNFDIAAGATLKLLGADQISSTRGGSINGTLDLNGHNTTLAGFVDDALFSDPPVAATGEIKLGGAQLTIEWGTGGFAGTISGSGSLKIVGDGSFLVLAGANTYTGGTTIESGELMISNTSGSGTGTGPVTVGADGWLSGEGFIVPSTGNQVTINGTLYPGGFEGDVLTFGSATTPTTVTLGPTSFLLIDICGCNEATSVYIYGQLQIATGATLDIETGTASPLSGTYTLATFTEGRTGSLFSSVVFNTDTILDPTAVGAFGGTHHLVYGANSITLEPSAIPEPATYAALAGLAALSLAFNRRPRRPVSVTT